MGRGVRGGMGCAKAGQLGNNCNYVGRRFLAWAYLVNLWEIQASIFPFCHISQLTCFLLDSPPLATPPLQLGKFVTCSYRNSSRGGGEWLSDPTVLRDHFPGPGKGPAPRLRASDSAPAWPSLSPASASPAGTRPWPRPRGLLSPKPPALPARPDPYSPAPPPPSSCGVRTAHSRFRFPRGLRLPPRPPGPLPLRDRTKLEPRSEFAPGALAPTCCPVAARRARTFLPSHPGSSVCFCPALVCEIRQREGTGHTQGPPSPRSAKVDIIRSISRSKKLSKLTRPQSCCT